MAKHSGSGGYKPGFKPSSSSGVLSAKAGLSKLEFQESLHPRGAGGKFADKPGSGDDAPKKGKSGQSREKEGSGSDGKATSSLSPSKINPSYELTIVAKGNPKKGTAAARYALYKPGMTVQGYVEALEKSGLGDKKQALRDLAWDMKQGWISAGPKKAGAPGTSTAGLGKEAAAASVAAVKVGKLDAGFSAKRPREGSSQAPIDASSFKKTGPQLGSNPGGTYQAPDGSSYYVKQAKSLGHAENELLADDLYKTLGVETLSPRSFTFNGGPATGSKIEKLTAFDPNNKAHVAEAQKNFATHAFLANWDAVGLDYDNLAFNAAGKLTMLDGGGALRFRAQGGDKPNFGSSVGELESLRSPTNEQAHRVFGSMTAAEVRKSAEPVLKLSDADIDAAVKRQVTDPTQAANYAKVLKARRDDIAARVGLPAPEAATTPPAPTVAPPASGTKSKVPLASGTPVKASTNPDPIPLGSKIELGDKLHFEVQGNPKKSTAAVRFDLYKDGMTLQDYVDAVGDKKQALKDVAWDMKQGWISASKAGASTPAAFGKAETLSTGAILAKAQAVTPAATAAAPSAAASAPKPPATTQVAPAPTKSPLDLPSTSIKSEFDALSGEKKIDLAKTVGEAAAAGGIYASPPTVVPTPSNLVAFEKPSTGSTALFKTTNEGSKDPYVVNATQISDPGLFGVKATLAKAEAATLKGTESGKAGAAQVAAAIKSKMIDPDGTILVISNTNGSYSGAVAATVAGETARIDHIGEFDPGQGPHLIDKLASAAASSGVTKLTVTTKASEFYLNNGFTATGTKDVYELNIGAKTSAYAAANASVGIQPKIQAGDKATLDVLKSIAPPQPPAEVSPGVSVTTVGSVVVGKTASGHPYDIPGGGGVAALDPNTVGNKVIGSSVKTPKLTDDQFVSTTSKIADKIAQLKSAGQKDGDSELAANNKAYKIAVDADSHDTASGTKLFGFSLGSTGAIKGAISGQTSPQSKTVVVTDHAGLGGGGGKEALDQLIYSAQAEGKSSILVKSGLTQFYASQGFSASLDHNGYLHLDIQPTTYKKPAAIYTGAHSVLAENLAKQIVKPSAVPDTTKPNLSSFKTYADKHVGEYEAYKTQTYDKPLDSDERLAVRSYSGNTYLDLNESYYTNSDRTESQKQMSARLDSAIAKSSFKSDHVLYRAMKGQSVLDMFAAMQPGDVFVSPAYTSTSVRSTIFGAGTDYATSMKIYARKGAKGAPIADLSKHPAEQETLLPRDAQLRYLGKDLNGFHEFEYV